MSIEENNINDYMNISIADYLGKMENGISTLLHIDYMGESYEGIYWYKNDDEVLTFPIELETKMGCIIENYDSYETIKEHLKENRADIDSIYDSLEDVKLSE